MSVLSSSVYGVRPSDFSLKKDAWLVGKFFANDINCFTRDTDQFPIDLGRSIKTTLKLSNKGLTCGERLQYFNPARSGLYEHIDLERTCDLYQDDKCLNVLVCVVKSRRPDFNFEVFTYKFKRQSDVIEFQDLFAEFVTGISRRRRRYEQSDFRSSSVNLSDSHGRVASRSGLVYPSNGSARSVRVARADTVRSVSSQPMMRSSTSNFLQRRPPVEEVYVRKSRIRDVGVQASRGKHGLYSNQETFQIFCHRTKVYGLNSLVVADVACMVSPSSIYDDYDGQAVAIIGNNYGYSRGRTAEHNDLYGVRAYTPPPRHSPDLGSRISSSFQRRNGREVQSRVVPISDSGSSEEIHVQLSGRPSRAGFGQSYYSHNYLESNTIPSRRALTNNGLNGNAYYGRNY